jgi:hypothetical protein
VVIAKVEVWCWEGGLWWWLSFVRVLGHTSKKNQNSACLSTVSRVTMHGYVSPPQKISPTKKKIQLAFLISYAYHVSRSLLAFPSRTFKPKGKEFRRFCFNG